MQIAEGIQTKGANAMDKTTTRKGRPPTTAQTMPLFFGAARGRIKEEIIMSAPTARELRSYVGWASGLLMMPDDEVLIRIVDHALTEYFKRDGAWRKARSEVLASAVTTAGGAASAKQQAGPSATVTGAKTDSRATNGTGAATAAVSAPPAAAPAAAPARVG